LDFEDIGCLMIAQAHVAPLLRVHCDPRRCPACGDEFCGETGLVLCDGARVHLDGARGVNCLIAYGQRWRDAALAGLRVLGVYPPDGFTLL